MGKGKAVNRKTRDGFHQVTCMFLNFAGLELTIATTMLEQNRLWRSKESSITTATNDHTAWLTTSRC